MKSLQRRAWDTAQKVYPASRIGEHVMAPARQGLARGWQLGYRAARRDARKAKRSNIVECDGERNNRD